MKNKNYLTTSSGIIRGLCSLLIIFGLWTTNSFGQTTVTFPSSGSFTVPSGATSMTVYVYGAGGGSGGCVANSADQAGGGGGGGACAIRTVTVSAGQVYTITVGGGGTAGGVGTPGGTGNPSSISGTAISPAMSADGGFGGAGAAAGVGAAVAVPVAVPEPILHLFLREEPVQLVLEILQTKQAVQAVAVQAVPEQVAMVLPEVPE